MQRVVVIVYTTKMTSVYDYHLGSQTDQIGSPDDDYPHLYWCKLPPQWIVRKGKKSHQIKETFVEKIISGIFGEINNNQIQLAEFAAAKRKDYVCIAGNTIIWSFDSRLPTAEETKFEAWKAHKNVYAFNDKGESVEISKDDF